MELTKPVWCETDLCLGEYFLFANVGIRELNSSFPRPLRKGKENDETHQHTYNDYMGPGNAGRLRRYQWRSIEWHYLGVVLHRQVFPNCREQDHHPL